MKFIIGECPNFPETATSHMGPLRTADVGGEILIPACVKKPDGAMEFGIYSGELTATGPLPDKLQVRGSLDEVNAWLAERGCGPIEVAVNLAPLQPKILQPRAHNHR